MRLVPVLAAAVLLAAACSSDDDTASDDRTATTTAATTEPTTAATEPAATTTATSEPTPTTTVPAPTTTTTTLPADPLLVATQLGAVRGTTSAVDGVRAFLNIPYAEPPVGPLRFAPPVTRSAWPDELDASESGASCPQTMEGITAQFLVTPDWDDDCLSLSVWAPDGAEGLPVMVWFHGGGLTTGSAHEPYYIGDQLAARGTVVVNVNYRLGALGFLDGNWGFLDQVEALDWVQDNIAGFGGDPGRVTIFGESAGGFSVCAHLATPQPGIFHQAIIQSGGGCNRLLSLDDANAATAEVLAAVSCADLDCLRGLPTEDLLAIPFNATLINDKATLDRTAFELARAGELPDRPTMTGFNADESTLFTVGLDEPTDDQLVELAAGFVDDPEAIVALYPPDGFETNLARYRALSTDLSFGCSAIAFADAAPGTYVYYLSYVSPSTPFDLGATHGAELAYLFGHPEGLTILEPSLEGDDQTVSELVQAAWVEFATTGSPGWEPYDRASGGGVMEIDGGLTFVDTIRDGRCEARLG
ncbi:MAG: carboxylesterase family protein [Ilumatobacter sp.]|uniref:carboxylesterase/lipase family protein n=1 Tax=Ilumatobacter sp. TaxID=1967498 RepID=UPI00262EB0A8|nr:carboxylesterase family protein [Ilumatobacter sp.]MDJ0770099.1 carboxylesterase family protein [Ilumatobacter sp.]